MEKPQKPHAIALVDLETAATFRMQIILKMRQRYGLSFILTVFYQRTRIIQNGCRVLQNYACLEVSQADAAVSNAEELKMRAKPVCGC